MKESLRFLITLLLVLGIAFSVQSYIFTELNHAWDSFLLVESYGSNFLMVAVSFTILMRFYKSKSFSLGFIFMGGFLVKMAIFMIFFKPTYSANNSISGFEFSAFFVPYAICLALETIILVSLLNRS